jgi:deoxyhypusine synthase
MYAAEKNLPIICPGWEDSTMGNILLPMSLKEISTMKSGIEYMTFLADWYPKILLTGWIFQIGGGIWRFPNLCGSNVAKIWKCRNTFWSYFCQISDSTTSYGSYSGAVPMKKLLGVN